MLHSLLSQSPFSSQPVTNVFSIEVIKMMSFPCSEPFNYFLLHLENPQDSCCDPRGPAGCCLCLPFHPHFMLICSHLRTLALVISSAQNVLSYGIYMICSLLSFRSQMFKCYLFKEAFQDTLYELTIPPPPTSPILFLMQLWVFWEGGDNIYCYVIFYQMFICSLSLSSFHKLHKDGYLPPPHPSTVLS